MVIARALYFSTEHYRVLCHRVRKAALKQMNQTSRLKLGLYPESPWLPIFGSIGHHAEDAMWSEDILEIIE